MGAVRVNQMGYSLNSAKQVLYVGKENAFFILEAVTQEMVYQGSLEEKGFDEASGDYVCTGDFSSVNQPGDYYIVINQERSLLFTVSEHRYNVCTKALLKAFYYQRCGVELQEQYAGSWSHPVCHLQPSYLFCQEAEELLNRNPKELKQHDTVGGWHDAGDYGRYTIATVKTVADLLQAYAHYPEVFLHPTDIPESKLKGADILHEAKIGLDFLFKMQRNEDGAVHTKVTSRHFPGMIMPEIDMAPLFIFDISSPATAGFAAVMAMASCTYREFDSDYASRCQDAAKKAYRWLQQNPEPLLFKNPYNLTSGEYGDICDIDERYWAAAQLYLSTGEEQYHEDFIRYYFMLKDRLSLGWKNVGGYGTIAYLFTNRVVNQEVYDKLKEEWRSHVSALEERSLSNGYGITLGISDYVWGSSMILMNQSIQLIIAQRLFKTSSYCHIIQQNWDYLFGRNPMDISYVTGLGEQSIKNPHHRPSASEGILEPVPGLVSGGPCAALVDEIVQEKCQGNPPAKCFADHTESYSTNEIDIYWNSPALYVGAYLCR
jgi:endoglucanase